VFYSKVDEGDDFLIFILNIYIYNKKALTPKTSPKLAIAKNCHDKNALKISLVT